MKRKIVVVIDAQNDFVNKDFVMGNSHNEEIVKDIANYLEHTKENREKEPCFIVFTQDMHFKSDYSKSIEGQTLPIHCVPDTEGFEIVPELKQYVVSAIRKDTFASPLLCNIVDFWRKENPDDEVEIEICGFVTDICVISNALLLRSVNPEVNITVFENLCGGTTEENHRAALQVMEANLINVKKWGID